MLERDPLKNPEELVRRVYAYVAYRMGDGPDAEDVTSEVFERAVRYRSSFDPSKGPPIGWLIGIAKRTADYALIARPEDAVAGAEEADARDVEEDALRRLALAAALEKLEPRDRELIALRYGADMTARQIAQVLELSTNAVEVALHRALGRLRAVMERDDDPGHPQRSLNPLEAL